MKVRSHTFAKQTRENAWRKSFATSWPLGTSPSAPPPTRRSRTEAAKARAALHASVAAQRIPQTCSALFRRIGGLSRVLGGGGTSAPSTTCRRPLQPGPLRAHGTCDRPTPERYALFCAGLGQDDAINVRGDKSRQSHRQDGRHQEWCLSPLARLHTGANRRRGPPTGVRHGHRDGQVHVSDHHVHNPLAPPASRHPSRRALTRKSTPSQQPCSQTCFPMVATKIQWTATSTDTQREREWEAKTTKKEHAKEGTDQFSVKKLIGAMVSATPAKGPLLRAHQRFSRASSPPGSMSSGSRVDRGHLQAPPKMGLQNPPHAKQVEGKKLLIECAKIPMILSATTRCLSLIMERLSMLSGLTFRSLHKCPQPHVMAFCEILNQLRSDHEHVVSTN